MRNIDKIKTLESIIDKDKILELCKNGISMQDSRLIMHGERVAFIATEIVGLLNSKKSFLNISRDILVILSLFHDVGAYKTEDIDRLVEFETVNVSGHSIYGYLFLKHFSPFAEYCEALLYHHTPYKRIPTNVGISREYASLIHLADRVDVGVMNDLSKDEILKSLQNDFFNPMHIDALKELFSAGEFYQSFKSDENIDYYNALQLRSNISYDDSVALLKMLIYTIDFKSAVTVEHSITATIISTYLAEKIGLDRQTIEKLYIATLVHDIGKLAIPNTILEKTARLTDEEMDLMRKHVIFSRQLLEPVLPKDILNMAVRHHEKLNGTGYPDRITANELTTEERIVAVADILSALVGKRSYKEEYSSEKTINILKSFVSNNHLDGYLVDIICDNIDELMNIIKSETEEIRDVYEKITSEYMVLKDDMKLIDYNTRLIECNLLLAIQASDI